MASCRVCSWPATVRAELADLYRRQVPLRTIAEQMTVAGYPVHRDAVHRHCRAHVAPADLLDLDHSDAEKATGIVVATLVAKAFEGWPGRAGRAASFLRAEGLTAAADALWAAADPPDSMRAGILAGVGTPASELLEARVLTQAVRNILGSGHPVVGHALAAACRDLGGDELANALDDLAASVEHSSDPAERAAEVQRRALAAALATPDFDDRGSALQHYADHTGDREHYDAWLQELRARRDSHGGS